MTFVSRTGIISNYKDTLNNHVVIYTDPTTRDRYTRNTNGSRNYITGSPLSTVGTPTAITDNLGTNYQIVSDSNTNNYVIYSDRSGIYYINSNGQRMPVTQNVQPVTPINPSSTVTPASSSDL